MRFQRVPADIDVRGNLSKVDVPTIVFYSRHVQHTSLEQGMVVASGIRNARFVPLESNNHTLLGHEPAWQAVTH